MSLTVTYLWELNQDSRHWKWEKKQTQTLNWILLPMPNNISGDQTSHSIFIISSIHFSHSPHLHPHCLTVQVPFGAYPFARDDPISDTSATTTASASWGHFPLSPVANPPTYPSLTHLTSSNSLPLLSFFSPSLASIRRYPIQFFHLELSWFLFSGVSLGG